MKISDLSYVQSADEAAIQGGFFFFFTPNVAEAKADAIASAIGASTFTNSGSFTDTFTTPHSSYSQSASGSKSVTY